MKLAQALLERGHLQKRIAQLKSRLNQNAKVQVGTEPAEEPKQLLAELDGCCSSLQELITRINITNAQTKSDAGVTLTAMLAEREVLGDKVDALRSFLSNASAVVTRGTKSEIVVQSTIVVAELQSQVDALSKYLRELDMKIQELNWTCGLI